MNDADEKIIMIICLRFLFGKNDVVGILTLSFLKKAKPQLKPKKLELALK